MGPSIYKNIKPSDETLTIENVLKIMNETEYQFLLLEKTIKELKFDVNVLPGKVDRDLKTIRESLNWIERHHLPTGVSKAMLEKVKDKTIYVTSEKGKNAVAFQIHNISKRPSRVYELIGIKITFGTSENGVPGITFEGNRKDPVVMDAIDFPWISDSDLKTPKKFIDWLTRHIIDPKDLSEKVEQFAVIDLGLVEMNELGLGEEDHQAMENKKIEEEKAKKSNSSVQTSSPPSQPPISPVPRRSPYYPGQEIQKMRDLGIDSGAYGWPEVEMFDY